MTDEDRENIQSDRQASAQPGTTPEAGQGAAADGTAPAADPRPAPTGTPDAPTADTAEPPTEIRPAAVRDTPPAEAAESPTEVLPAATTPADTESPEPAQANTAPVQADTGQAAPAEAAQPQAAAADTAPAAPVDTVPVDSAPPASAAPADTVPVSAGGPVAAEQVAAGNPSEPAAPYQEHPEYAAHGGAPDPAQGAPGPLWPTAPASGVPQPATADGQQSAYPGQQPVGGQPTGEQPAYPGQQPQGGQYLGAQPPGIPTVSAGYPAAFGAQPQPGQQQPGGQSGTVTEILPAAGYQQGGYPPYGQPPPPGTPGAWQQTGGYGQQPPAGRGKRWLAAAAVAVVLVLGGGVVGGVTEHALSNGGVTESPVVSDPVSAKSGSLAGMVAKVQPSVVSLKVQPDGSQGGDEGSGVIIRSDGMILTNNHVVSAVAGGGGSITVSFSNGKQASAKIVGTDPSGDLAVVQAQGVSGLKPATLGDSTKLRVGDGVIAIGSPLGLEGSVTEGIVSALNRSYSVAAEEPQQQQNQDPFGLGQQQQQQQQQQSGAAITIPDAIQTDAAINPGNSGGPLLNMSGQVIGINSAIRSSDSGSSSGGQAGSIGIGFAIPMATAKATADTLMKGGQVAHPKFGVSVTDAVSDQNANSGSSQGALVAAVTKGGPADKAGLKKGDVITKVDGTSIGSADALVTAVGQHKPGDKITVSYSRDGKAKTAKATLVKSS